MITIVGDLHLGAGDAREDFLLWGNAANGPAVDARARAQLQLDEAFARFLARRLAAAPAGGTAPILVLLGDTFDFWQAQRRGEKPAACLERILSAHVTVTAALRDWIGAGARIEVVIGNHDQPLVDGDAWGLLGEILPGVNPSSAGAPRHYYAHEGAGLYAEHGHQWDPHNRIRRLDRPDAGCAGREVVRRLVNPHEAAIPWIDKGATLSDTLRLAERAMPRDLLHDAFHTVARGIRTAANLLRAIQPWRLLQPSRADEVAAREVRSLNRGIARALSTRPGGTIGPLPPHLRFFASAHTHEALDIETRGGAVRLNPGTWRPIAELPESRDLPRMVQPLSYVEITPRDGVAWESRLGRWMDEDTDELRGGAPIA